MAAQQGEQKTLGVVATGVIGGGWAVRALSRGWDVIAWDPAPDAEAKLHDSIERAWPSVVDLGLFDGASPDRVTFVDSPEAVAEAADWIQTSAPENETIKIDLLTKVAAVAPQETVIASSSSGLLPTRLQQGLRHPERFLIGHPFNPVYLLPLVEIVPGELTSIETVDRARAHYDDLVMHPLVVRKEIEGYLSDRLQEALWREVLHMVNDGVATTEELDDAIAYGPGLRWAGMGTNLTFHLAGGQGGMRHMLAQFGPALKLPWTKLEAPELTDTLIDDMATGCEAQADGRSIDELERMRDDYVIAVMKALEPLGLGAGEIQARRRDRIASPSDRTAAAASPDADDPLSPVVENPIELDRYALSTVIYAERDDGQILLMKRAEGTAMAGQYFMPGGIVDPGETPYEAAARELFEETGLSFVGDIEMVGSYPMWVYGQDFLQLSFRGRVEGEVVQSDEHTDHRWVDASEMTGLFAPDAVDALSNGDERIADLLAKIGADLDRYLALRP